MNRSRVLAGARAQANGEAFEARLDAQHAIYALTRAAYVVRVPQPVRRIRPLGSGQFVACYVSEGPPDYMGIVNGRPVVFDAKSCASLPWSLGGLAPHQAKHLDAAQAEGGLSFILLAVPGSTWLLPWEHLGPRWLAWASRKGRSAPGSASLSAEDLEEIGRRVVGVDWVPAIGGAA